MTEQDVSPEQNFQRNRGVIVGPIIGVFTGATISIFADVSTGFLVGGCMGVGLLTGAAADYLRRAPERKRNSTTARASSEISDLQSSKELNTNESP